MANNMDSFDFGALDSAALDETLSFLNSYDPTLLPDPSFGGFEGLGEPMMNWPVADDSAWVPFGNADLSGGVTNVLTDNSVPGFHLHNPGWDFRNQPCQQHQAIGTETSLDFGESRILRRVNNLSESSPTLGFPAGLMTPGGLVITKESALQGSGLDICDFKKSYLSVDPIPLPRLTCDWPSCKSTTAYGTNLELYHHKTDVHIAEILNAWPGSCPWPGCNSKIFFKTSKRLESHVYNIHITPLFCTTSGCEHKRPFERQADLERHVASKHMAQRKYKCPYPQCSYSSSFSRKDKLKHHERSYHGQFACKFGHCIYGFPSEKALRKHESSYWHHRFLVGYECGLGSCGRTSASCFSHSYLRQHLEYDHMISSVEAKLAMDKLHYPDGTLVLAHFPNGFSDFQDCGGCIKKLKEVASGKDGGNEK